MKLIYGFFMAWGNFMTIPCPCKIWNGKAKNAMMGFLPIIGFIIGLLWMAVFWVLNYFNIPPLITTFFMVFYIFAICGFIHMDGFMDTNDAVLSRRPLEERQRILKDSTVGAFAVVMVIFLILGWVAGMYTALDKLSPTELLVIPIVSRAMAGLGVLSCKPIGHSQYKEVSEEPDRKAFGVMIILETVFFVGGAYLFFGNDIRIIWESLVAVVVFLIAMTYGRKNLGGISGDISGYAICFSEIAAIMTLAVL